MRDSILLAVSQVSRDDDSGLPALSVPSFLVGSAVMLSSPLLIEMEVEALGIFLVQGKSVAQISLLLIVL